MLHNTQAKSKVRLYAGFCAARCRAVAIIPLGRRSRAGSSHLPAASPSQVIGCLFGVAPRRDCPFHPLHSASATQGLVSVALILTSRWAGVTCYAALRSPDVPPALLRPPLAGYAGPAIARRTLLLHCSKPLANRPELPGNPVNCRPARACAMPLIARKAPPIPALIKTPQQRP